MMYNIGLQKLILQMFVCEHNQMIYEIPNKEKFFGFIEFSNFLDLGFIPKGLAQEACSHFAFLTLNKSSQKILVNVMLIDPYYSDIQISLFQSSSFFYEKLGAKYYDIVLKSIMYNTGTEVKMLQ